MSETFIWIPTYGTALTQKPSVSVNKFGDGYEQRVAIGINTIKRKWDVSFANRPTSTADAIEAFFEARASVQSFNWQPPHGAVGKWVCREWSAQKTGPYTRSVTATFDEVFE